MQRDYRYPLQQRASTLWYHDHTMDFTGPNVYRGLAGFFLVGDEQDDALPLPRGDRDLPLMVCDRAFAADGSFRYPALSPEQVTPGVQTDYMAGVLGDVVLVNGVAMAPARGGRCPVPAAVAQRLQRAPVRVRARPAAAGRFTVRADRQ